MILIMSNILPRYIDHGGVVLQRFYRLQWCHAPGYFGSRERHNSVLPQEVLVTTEGEGRLSVKKVVINGKMFSAPV